jgi:TolB-like protein/class 3 adenylate cyclase
MSETRKLVAILVADVVGYSRLAGADEERTLARLRGLRSDLIDPAIAVHHGRIVKRTGDGSIIEFRSVVDAVRCAIEVQTGLIERNAGLPPERRIEFRVGIHVGDVVEEADGDLMGDGVNIAARLEAVCEPGGVCLSGAAYEQVRDRVKERFVDLGEKALKNIARPVRAYAMTWDRAAKSETDATATPPRLSLPDKPSIAVLPFQSMSGDPEQDYFADGMVEDIITGLSRIKWLFVIARNSSFIYKGKPLDVRQVGRELGVRYVLEGGVRKSGVRLRITAQLVEAETGAHLRADKFDGALEDVFNLQDQITDRVVGIVEPSVRKSEIERSRRKRPGSLSAYDLYLRALPHVMTLSHVEASVAAELLEAALKLDPDYHAAHAYLAFCHQARLVHDGRFDERNKASGIRHARAAIASGVDDATALAVAAITVAHLEKDFDASLDAIERALSHNASCATALFFGGEILAWKGEPATATAYAQRALRLSPFDPLAYAAHIAMATAAIHEDRYDDAAACYGKAARANPGHGMFVIAQAQSLALAGRLDEARPIWAEGLKLEPEYRIRTLLEVGLIPSIFDKLARAARLLGARE